MNLLVPTKIEVKPALGKGMGVFATDTIYEGEIVEECHLLTIPGNLESNIFVDYRFVWPRGVNYIEYVLPFGYGCIYNHSYNPNLDWRNHPELKAFQFFALTLIEPGQELCTYYGDEEYWKHRPYIKVV